MFIAKIVPSALVAELEPWEATVRAFEKEFWLILKSPMLVSPSCTATMRPSGVEASAAGSIPQSMSVLLEPQPTIPEQLKLPVFRSNIRRYRAVLVPEAMLSTTRCDVVPAIAYATANPFSCGVRGDNVELTRF